MRGLLWTLSAAMLLLAVTTTIVGEEQSEDDKRRSIRLKTTGQLKKIFAELEINYQDTMTKEQLQELAYETDAVEKWLELHPEKRRRKNVPPPGKHEKPPDMDQAQWEQLLRKLHRDKQPSFDHIKDPERRSILEKLSRAGLQMPNSEDMSMEQLRNLAKILDDIPNMASGAQHEGDAGNVNNEEEEVHEL